jgi:hypothetical protein
MSKKRMVDTNYWTDPWVVDHLEPLDRYVFVYLFTNSHTTVAGVYELSLKVMGWETGLEKSQLETILEHLKPKVLYVEGWVILTNGIKNQSYNSPKIKTGILLALEGVDNTITQHINWPEDFGSQRPKRSEQLKLGDTVSIPLGGLSHSNSKVRANSNSNSKVRQDTARPGKPAGLRRNFGAAVEQDLDQAERAQLATERGRPGYQAAVAAADVIKKRKHEIVKKEV